MEKLSAYRYRIYPNPEQGSKSRQFVGCCRVVANVCIDQRNLERERSNPRNINVYSQINELPALKEAAPFLKDAPSHILQQAVIDVGTAFKRFFDGDSKYPKFKKKGDKDSFRFPDPKQFQITPTSIILPKLGKIDMIMHRPIRGEPKNVTVSLDGECWYVSIQTSEQIADPVAPNGEPVGIDLGVAKPIVLSTGEMFDIPKTTDKQQRRTAALQSAINRRQKGSKNRKRAIRDLSRHRAKLKRKRVDAAHKATIAIVKNHSVIALENLNVKNMTSSAKGTVEEPGKNVAQKSGLNRVILDVAPGDTRRMLEYKARWHGATIVRVPPAYTSQRCSKCGYVHADNRLTQELFLCGKCGHTENADVNAAKNILQLGLEKIRATEGYSGVVCESNRATGRKQKSCVVRHGSPVL